MNEQLKVIISAEIDKFKKNVEDAINKTKDFKKEGTKNFKSFNDEFQKIGNVSKTVLGVMAGAMAGAGLALFALGERTKEYREQQNMLATAFEVSGGSAETAKQTYNDLYRVLGDSGQATEAAQHLAKLTTEEQALSEWTNICQGVYATFGASLPIESLTEAVNHSAKLGEVQGTLADALEWSGINVDDFNAKLLLCNDESEREKLIRETLNGTYSEAAATYEKNNAEILKQRDAQAKLTEAQAKLGEVTTPIMTMLIELGTKVLSKITPYLQDFGEKYLPEIEKILIKVGEAIGKVIDWVVDNWELVSTIAIIVAAISAALTVLSTVMAVVNAVMLASPIAWIVAAIAALIAIIVLCVKHWDDIKAAVSRAWEAMKNAFGNVANWFDTKVKQPIVNAFNAVWTKIQSIGSNIKNFFKNLFNFNWSLPKLKLPKFSITPAGWSVGDLLKGQIPKLSITWNARGGVFDKPTLFNYGDSLQGIGENGAEAVVPLENNLEWLDKIATRLANKMQPAPVVLQVDGKTFAKTAVTAINDLTRQQGKLSLNLV